MSRKNRKRFSSSGLDPKAKSWARRHAFWLSLGLTVVAALAAAGYFTRPPDIPSAPQPIVKMAQKAFTLDRLLAMTPEELAGVDIAEMNLLCATGLPGAEALDIAHCLATLDRWADRVRSETERHLYRVHDPKWADHYRHSEAYLRAEFLLQVLQEDLSIKYDLTAKDNFDFKDSRVAFIHGMIPAPGQSTADVTGGTCASMPVMYAAVGRRLGYPLRLVTTKGHIFVRWDGANHPNPTWRERLNIEGAGQGFSSLEDDYYKSWPLKVSEAEVQANGWLKSLTAAEEFAEFLAARGHCGTDNGEVLFAARCFENAYRYDPARRCYRDWFLEAAAQSGYRPKTPALASLLARRRSSGGAWTADQIIAKQQAAARREWMRSQGTARMPVGIPTGPAVPMPSGMPSTRPPSIPGIQQGSDSKVRPEN